MFLSTMQTLPFTKFLRKSKTLTQNDKVVKEQSLTSRSSESQDHNAASL